MSKSWLDSNKVRSIGSDFQFFDTTLVYLFCIEKDDHAKDINGFISYILNHEQTFQIEWISKQPPWTKLYHPKPQSENCMVYLYLDVGLRNFDICLMMLNVFPCKCRSLGMCKRCGDVRLIACSKCRGTGYCKSNGPFSFNFVDDIYQWFDGNEQKVNLIRCAKCQARGHFSCPDCSSSASPNTWFLSSDTLFTYLLLLVFPIGM